jgi:opacity protein-like surface antigen
MEPKSMEIPQAEPFSWTGFYFDLGAGAVITNFDQGDYETAIDLHDQFDNRLPPAMALSSASSSVAAPSGEIVDFAFFGVPGHSDTDVQPMVGFDFGYMKQWGHFVVGGNVGFYGTHTQTSQEASGSQVNFIEAEPSQAPAGRIIEADTDFVSKRRVEETWSGYAGAQAGYAMDHWLFYATGGVAFAQIEVRQVDRAFTEFFFEDDATTSSPAVSRSSVSKAAVAAPSGIDLGSTDSRAVSSRGSVQDGWFAGGGVMFAFAENMSVGLEYKHVEFGDETYRFKTRNGIFPGQTPVDVSNDQILAKITFLLGSRLHK